ncbi:MAG: endonuclease/exonuclease/phosphatase family protein [Limnochordaceae bacterium]|nr:endonuclease/exonuclease/phosphatase family protein [Limnochordaceae bacterium]
MARRFQQGRLGRVTRGVVLLSLLLLSAQGVGAGEEGSTDLTTAVDQAIPEGAGVTLTVMTYNIHHGQGRDGKFDLERIASVIEQAGADLVGLQEVDENWAARSQFLEEASWLAKRLGMQYVFAPALKRPSLLGAEAGYGNALLSRYPIVPGSTEILLLPKQGTREDRVLLRAEVQVGTECWQVAVTHLGLSRSERVDHVRQILARLQSFRGPTILMGDWNDRPDSPEVSLVTTQLQDVAAVAQAQDGDPRPTFAYDSPDGRPNMRIDYIFASAALQVRRVWTIDSVGSDHLPLVAQLQAVSAALLTLSGSAATASEPAATGQAGSLAVGS